MYSVIVVDDEPGALEATSEFITKVSSDFSVVGRFTHAQDALDFMSANHTDLVITDIKMPGMSGLELIECIYEKKLKCTVVVISGYRDFEYARTALKYGVREYITKPVNFSEFTNLLKKIKENLDAENNPDELIKLKQEQFMAELYFGNPEREFVKEQFSKLSFSYPLEKLCGCVIEMKFDDFLKYSTKYDKEQFDTLLYNIFNTAIPCEVYVLSHNGNSMKAMVIAEDVGSDIFSKIYADAQNLMGTSFAITNVYKFDTWQQLADEKVYADNKEDCMMLLMSYIQEGNITAANELYNNIVEQNRGDTGAGNMPSENSTKATIDSIKDFVEKNYNRDISRADVAQYIYMNEAYIGRIFKQYMGISIHDYHMDIRLRKAIEMLSNGDKVSVVCKAIGYTDKRKFMRNFKSYTGYTPSEYKKRVLNMPDFDTI